MAEDIQYAWAKEDDAVSITTLFNAASPAHCRNVSYWKWSNLATPFGKSLAAIARIDGRVIAHYSIVPTEFLMEDRPITVGFCQQAVVQKEYRSLEVIMNLMGFVVQEGRKQFPFMYAFPNDNFFPVKKKFFHWDEVDVFPADAVKVEDLLFLKPASVAINELNIFPEIGWFSQNISGLSIRKTTEYLNWRFFRHPINHYIVWGAFDQGRLVGYLVLKMYLRTEDNDLIGHFVDFDSKDADPSILRSMISAAGAFFKSYGITEVVFWNRDQRFKDLFRSFVTGQRFKTNLGILINDKNLGTIAKDKERWSFTMSASDSF